MWRDCSARPFKEKLDHWDGADGTEEKLASIEKGSERRCKPWMGGFLDVYPREALEEGGQLNGGWEICRYGEETKSSLSGALYYIIGWKRIGSRDAKAK